MLLLKKLATSIKPIVPALTINLVNLFITAVISHPFPIFPLPCVLLTVISLLLVQFFKLLLQFAKVNFKHLIDFPHF